MGNEKATSPMGNVARILPYFCLQTISSRSRTAARHTGRQRVSSTLYLGFSSLHRVLPIFSRYFCIYSAHTLPTSEPWACWAMRIFPIAPMAPATAPQRWPQPQPPVLHASCFFPHHYLPPCRWEALQRKSVCRDPVRFRL